MSSYFIHSAYSLGCQLLLLTCKYNCLAFMHMLFGPVSILEKNYGFCNFAAVQVFGCRRLGTSLWRRASHAKLFSGYI
jgi:hypothetical protein